MVGHTDTGAPESPLILVAAFVAASSEALQFLHGERGFHTAVTVDQWTERGLIEVPADAVTGPFNVRRTFGTRRLAGTMTYGERELEVNLIVSRRLPILGALGPYALWEWVAAFDGAARWQGTGSWLSTTEREIELLTVTQSAPASARRRKTSSIGLRSASTSPP